MCLKHAKEALYPKVKIISYDQQFGTHENLSTECSLTQSVTESNGKNTNCD